MRFSQESYVKIVGVNEPWLLNTFRITYYTRNMVTMLRNARIKQLSLQMGNIKQEKLCNREI